MNDNQTNQNTNQSVNATNTVANNNIVSSNETVVNEKVSTQTPNTESVVNPSPVVSQTQVNNVVQNESTNGSTLASGTPSASSNVNPVLKETSKVSFSNTPQEEPKAVSNDSISPMEESRGETKQKSLIPLILFFIFLFAFVFFLPDITDYFKEKEGRKKIEEFDRQLREEEEKQKKEEEQAKKEEENKHKEEEKYKSITCVSLPKDELNTTVVTTQELTYGSGKLKSVKIMKSTEYKAIDTTYEMAKEDCENKSILVASIEGYEFSCAVSELMIEESNLFELKDFKSQTVTKEDGTTEEISTNYIYDTSIEKVQKELETEGYTCK